MFSPGDFVFFSLSTSRFFPFWFWKRDFFLVLFLPAVLFVVVVRRRHFSAFLVGRPSPKKVDTFCCAECRVTLPWKVV
jgi:hypothetical protein